MTRTATRFEWDLRQPPPAAARFTVPGRTATKGSTVGFFSPRAQRVIVKQDSARLAAWSRDVAWAARAGRVRCIQHPGAVAIWACFYVKPFATEAQFVDAAVLPDVDKASRALLDALTGVAYQDDRQVVDLVMFKRLTATDERTEVCLWGVSA